MAETVVVRDDSFMSIDMSGMMTMLLMIIMISLLGEMSSLQQSQVPGGLSQLTVSADYVGSRLYLNPPWMSFTLTNSGPGGLVVEVNGEEVRTIDRMIPQGGTLDVNMGYAVIEMIFVQAPHGNAVAQIFGIRGRPQ